MPAVAPAESPEDPLEGGAVALFDCVVDVPVVEVPSVLSVVVVDCGKLKPLTGMPKIVRVEALAVVTAGVKSTTPLDAMGLSMDMLCPGVTFDVHCEGNADVSGWTT